VGSVISASLMLGLSEAAAARVTTVFFLGAPWKSATLRKRCDSSRPNNCTTMGDIHLVLSPDKAPKTVENFVGLTKKGYYDNVIFHRVIKGFMIQTGDPLGDGTGGESLWGKVFEDEFHPMLKHDRPYTLSMANSGPNTNGSQFFITTAAAPWLDNKHTVLGRATAGFDIIHNIEHLKVDKLDRPYEEMKIMNVELR